MLQHRSNEQHFVSDPAFGHTCLLFFSLRNSDVAGNSFQRLLKKAEDAALFSRGARAHCALSQREIRGHWQRGRGIATNVSGINVDFGDVKRSTFMKMYSFPQVRNDKCTSVQIYSLLVLVLTCRCMYVVFLTRNSLATDKTRTILTPEPRIKLYCSPSMELSAQKFFGA